jgi:hypothetical protein
MPLIGYLDALKKATRSTARKLMFSLKLSWFLASFSLSVLVSRFDSEANEINCSLTVSWSFLLSVIDWVSGYHRKSILYCFEFPPYRGRPNACHLIYLALLQQHLQLLKCSIPVHLSLSLSLSDMLCKRLIPAFPCLYQHSSLKDFYSGAKNTQPTRLTSWNNRLPLRPRHTERDSTTRRNFSVFESY